MRHGRASFGIAALLALVACGGERKAPQEEAGEAGAASETAVKLDSTFVDARHGYRLSYPSAWTLADHSASDHAIRADLSQGRTAGLQIRVLAPGGGSFEDRADRYARGFREEMVSHWGGAMDELDRGFRSLGGNPVFRVSFHARRTRGGEWLLVNYLVPRGDDLIVFQCGARFEDRRIYEGLFEAVVSSLELASPG